MARKTTSKTTRTKAGKPKKNKRKPERKARTGLAWIFYYLVLFVLLFFSIGLVGYVIFFRTVVAAELPLPGGEIIFEEPVHPGHEIFSGVVSGSSDHDLPRVAILIDDMGYHPDIGKDLLRLDLNLSFSFLPFAPFTAELEESVYQGGRTILLHLPLEPRSEEWDPGPGAMYLKDDRIKKEQTLDRNLQMVPHATGINNHMGSLFTADADAMGELAEILEARQLFFVDSFTTPLSKGLERMRDQGVSAERRHIFLDNMQQSQAVCEQLEKLAALARRQGSAIGIGHPYRETLEALQTCAPDILKQVTLVGVESLVH